MEETLARRRSVRSFTAKALSLEQLGQLAWAGQGITEKKRGFRTAPSAGALYPIELYFVTAQGLFTYDPHGHSLTKETGADMRAALYKAVLEQEFIAQAPCSIVIAGARKIVAIKYGNRARRYMLIEAGHVGENILLQAAAMELGAVPVGAFEDKKVARICRLKPGQEPLLIIPLGHPAGD